MQVQVTGRHMDVTESLREYSEEKITRAAKLVNGDKATAEVRLRVEKNPSIENPQVAEVTIHLGGRVIRAQEAATDMYAAIDLAADKIERQLRKYKTKVLDRHNGKVKVKTAPGDSELPPIEGLSLPEEEEEPAIVRTKVLDLKPMTDDEAILQLELLGHDFFVYQSATDNALQVLYRRKDGDFGLIVAR